MLRRSLLNAATACVLLLGVVFVAAAAEAPFPAKPVRIIVPYPPGGLGDIFPRALATRLAERIAQPVIVDNRPGGSQIIGAQMAAKSAPDGYTLFFGSVTSLAINVSAQKNLPYDPLRDFTAVGLIVESTQALVIHPALPVKNLKDLVALARQRPGQLNYGSSGPGTNTHLSGVLFNLLAGVNIVHVPYKSTPPMLVDVMAGQIELSYPGIASVTEHARSGRLRLLAQTGARRSASAPDVPTMQESGLPGYNVTTGFGFMGPAGLSRPIVERLNAAMVQAVRLPATVKSFLDNGVDGVASTPEEYDAFNRAEIARWIKVARDGGIKPE